MDRYRPTREGRLWHAILGTYYIDAAMRNNTDYEWQSLLLQANSEWTKNICFLIQLNHSFFIDNLKKVHANRHLISAIQQGIVFYKDGTTRKF